MDCETNNVTAREGHIMECFSGVGEVPRTRNTYSKGVQFMSLGNSYEIQVHGG